MQRASRSEWQERVARWRHSDMSGREFAASIGVNANTLTWWAGQFSREGVAPRRRGRARANGGGAKFSEVTSSESGPLALVEVHTSVEETRFEIALPSGRRVLVPQRFDSEALDRLLAVLS